MMNAFKGSSIVAISFAFLVAGVACGSSDETTGDHHGVPEAGADALADVLDADATTTQDAGRDATDDVAEDVVIDHAADVAADVMNQDSGAHDAGPGWPSCDAPPAGMSPTTLSQIWTDDPKSPKKVWLTGLFVSAISKGACHQGAACQVFVQDAETFGSLAQGAHHAIKLFVSSKTSEHFVSLKVGDKVQVLANAWRYDFNPSQHELLLQVNLALPGCAKVVGQGNLKPIEGVHLSDLTADAYENGVGPLLVKIQKVSGKPGATNETFALWNTNGPFVEAGIDSVVSASPYFLAGGTFSGLPTDGQTRVDFSSVAGVFGLFVPKSSDGGTSPKFLMLYPRDMNELPHN